jgi:hypothetical protein
VDDFPYASWTISDTQAALYDRNKVADTFDYTVTVVNTTTGQEYSVDPEIKNGGGGSGTQATAETPSSVRVERRDGAHPFQQRAAQRRGLEHLGLRAEAQHLGGGVRDRFDRDRHAPPARLVRR